MSRGSSGFERPPWWAVVVIVVGLVFLAVAVPYALHRGSSTASAKDVGTPLVDTTSGSSTARTQILVVGDSYTGGSGQGGNGPNGWALLMGDRLNADGYNVAITIRAAGGSGYVYKGPSGKTMADLAGQGAGPTTSVVIFFGSRNDSGQTSIQGVAAGAYRTVLAAAPKAKLVVIGPPYTGSNAPANFLSNRDQVKAAAASAGAALFVDPIAEDWFGGANYSLIGADGVHPTDAGHKRMADLIAPRIEQLLATAGAGSTSSANPSR